MTGHRGVPPVTPGASQRELRLEHRLLVFTGEGKGKSTAAFGMGLRAWAQGWSTGVFQFVKSAKWRTGEAAAYAALGEMHRTTGQGGPVEWHTMGAGWTWLRATQDADPAALARAGWERVAAQLAGGVHRLYILDEFSYPLARGWVDVDEVLEVLARRPSPQHVVITGRGVPPAVCEAADLVTEMTKIAHPFDRGAKGQPGIEW